MMKNLFICFLLVIFANITLLNAINVNDKQSELENINKQILDRKKFIQETENKKKTAEQSVKQISTKLKDSNKVISQLAKTEDNLLTQITQSVTQINQTNSKLNDVQKVGTTAFTKLLVLDNQDRIFHRGNRDRTLISFLVTSTLQIQQQLSIKVNELSEIKKVKESSFKTVQFNKLIEQKKKQNLSGQVSSLKKDIKQYEHEKKLHLKKIKQLEESARAIQKLIEKLQKQQKPSEQSHSYKFSQGTLNWPVKGKIIRSFGNQPDAKYNISTINNGIDIAVPEGTSVVAADDGEVVFADWFTGAGKLVIIDHKNGFHTLYSYNTTLLVSKGQKIKRKQAIALSGKTGSAQQPSLHFEVRKNGKPVDPLGYLN